jgi:DNA primase
MSPYELIKNVKIEEIISKYITFEDDSNSDDIRAICPFHLDSNPSFSINANKQVYYCFGCKRGGNVITFIRDIENISKEEAIQYLKKLLGIETSIEDFELLTEITKYYQQKLPEIIPYLEKRKLNTGIGEDLQLGFSGLDSFELYKKFPDHKDKLIEYGLVYAKYENTPNELIYSAFTNRLMFPVENHLGIIGFVGRALGEQENKYMNSIENKYFKRRTTLYGLQKAKDYIKEQNQAILVEGLIDVGRAWKIGYRNTVASLGSALTEEQALLLKRYAKRVTIFYDGDQAGYMASVKAALQLMAIGLEFDVVDTPIGEDPDSIFIKNDKDFLFDISNSFDYIKQKVNKEDFLNYVKNLNNASLIDPKFFSLYNLVKENIVSEPIKTLKSNSLIESSPLFHLTLLLDKFPELEEEIDNSVLERTIESREDPNISKILFNKNPYENIKDPDKMLKRILEEIK